MLVTLTWCHCAPADTPTRIFHSTISTEIEIDDVAFTFYIRHQEFVLEETAAPLHQSCPVTIDDCKVVVGTGVFTVFTGFNFK